MIHCSSFSPARQNPTCSKLLFHASSLMPSLSFLPKTLLPSIILLRIVLDLTLIQATVGQSLEESCRNPVRNCDASTNYFPKRISIRYAENIKSLRYFKTFVEFTVQTGGKDSTWKYRLVKCGCPPGKVSKGRQVIFTDPTSVYVGDGPILGLLEGLIPSLRPLRYVSRRNTIFSPAVRGRINNGRTRELTDSSFVTDFDRLQKDPSLGASLINQFSVRSYEQAKTGKPYLVIAEVAEGNPLGRAEWVKVMGLLFDNPNVANNNFNEIVKGYEDVKRQAAGAVRRPSLFFNSPFRSSWFVPVQKQFTTAFARDANADYLFADDGRDVTRQLSFSEILKNFKSAQYLVNAGSFPNSRDTTLTKFIKRSIATAPGELSYMDLVKQLDSVRCANVWSNQKRITADGLATDFFESAAFRPDLVLAEYVRLLHPELKVKSKFTYMYSYGRASQKLIGGPCPYKTLNGKAPKGKAFIDKFFVVTKQNRFQIEEVLEDKVLPRLKAIPDVNAVDVFFTNAFTSKDVSLTVRILTEKRNAKFFKGTKLILVALKDRLRGNVKEISSKEYRRRLLRRRKLQSP